MLVGRSAANADGVAARAADAAARASAEQIPDSFVVWPTHANADTDLEVSPIT